MNRSLPFSALAFGLLFLQATWPASQKPGVSQVGSQRIQRFLDLAQTEMGRGRFVEAHAAIYQVLERDPASRAGWRLLVQWAQQQGDADLELWARYREWRLAESQGLKPAQRKALLAELQSVDPTGGGLFELTGEFTERLQKLAEKYEKQGRPHGAIRVYERLLSLDPENRLAEEAVERIASAPDPSLAPHATPVDLFEGVDQAFIDAFDAKHSTW
ncbi:MAG: hypothetical protein KDB61_06015, partial [Planctomycetes bacterium]|nr:hypothetical protein [Planctomycetota bacterium]